MERKAKIQSLKWLGCFYHPPAYPTDIMLIMLILIVLGCAAFFASVADKIIPTWILDPITDSPQISTIALIISLFGSKPLAKMLSIKNVYVKAVISLLIYITSAFLLVYIFSLI